MWCRFKQRSKFQLILMSLQSLKTFFTRSILSLLLIILAWHPYLIRSPSIIWLLQCLGQLCYKSSRTSYPKTLFLNNMAHKMVFLIAASANSGSRAQDMSRSCPFPIHSTYWLFSRRKTVTSVRTNLSQSKPILSATQMWNKKSNFLSLSTPVSWLALPCKLQRTKITI